MIEYQRQKLAEHGFTESDEDGFNIYFRRKTEFTRMFTSAEIEVRASHDPEFTVYQAEIRVYEASGLHITKYLSGKKYKLLDVIADISKIEAVVKSIDKVLGNGEVDNTDPF
jgi:hypothetical protein